VQHSRRSVKPPDHRGQSASCSPPQRSSIARPMANRSVQSLLRRLSPEAQVAAFSSAFQVVTFDHRRVGASEGQPPYKVEQWPRTRCGSSITWLRQIFTKPYTPKTNGKAERFIQTVLRESEAAIAAVHRTTRNGASPRPAPSLSFHSEWHKRRVVWIVDA
jgi:hypothetical protein